MSFSRISPPVAAFPVTVYSGAMQRKVSLKDVARAAGVHVSTVSRALHPETATLLSAEVAKHVRDVAEQLGYCPDVMAAGLRTRRSGAIGLVVPDLTHPAFPAMLRGAEMVLGAAGYVVLVVSVEHDFSRAPALLRQMRGRRLDGIIIATAQADDPFLTAALAEHIPLVAANITAAGDPPAFAWVAADEKSGIGQAMDYLRGLGHTRIGHLAGPTATMTGRGRLAAFLSHGGDGRRVATASIYDRPGAHDACRQLLDRFPPGTADGVTALVTASDLLALGCLDVLNERGLSCPGDLSLVGFMDLPHMDLINPALTTIRTDLPGVGEWAARLLLPQLAASVDRPPPQARLMPVDLVVRRSCRAV